MKVENAMSKRLVTARPEMTLREASKIMIKENVSFLVVISNGELYGVISEKDIVRALAEDRNPDTTKISDVCTRKVITVRKDDLLSYAAGLMRRHGIRHLVVVDDNGRPIGVLSIRDLLREAETLKKIEEMTPDQLQDWWFG